MPYRPSNKKSVEIPGHSARCVFCLQCSALGASFCYLLSYLIGRLLVLKYFPEKVASWSSHVSDHQFCNSSRYDSLINLFTFFQVNKHRENLLWYIIFLRITPFLPNWFINITSPVIHVPLFPFFMGTFFGKHCLCNAFHTISMWMVWMLAGCDAIPLISSNVLSWCFVLLLRRRCCSAVVRCNPGRDNPAHSDIVKRCNIMAERHPAIGIRPALVAARLVQASATEQVWLDQHYSFALFIHSTQFFRRNLFFPVA